MLAAQFERQVWLLDQKINARGFRVDTSLAKKAAMACAQEKIDLDTKVTEITNGAVTSATQVAKVKAFLSKRGVILPNMQAGTLELALEDDSLEAEAKQIIEARQRVSKSSTAKFLRILSAVGPDKRLRGGLQYGGAARTLRWAGRIFQPHNLPRPSRKLPEIRQAIKALQDGTADLLTDNVHQLCSDVARSIIVAEPGYKLVVSDYSAIEGRVLAWLAGENWKLKDYAADKDMYIRTYQKMFGLSENAEVDSDQRQQGKCFELSMGYEGGVNALLNSAKTYGVDVVKVGAGSWRAAPRSIQRLAEKLYGYALKRGDPTPHTIGKKLYMQLEAAKTMWRSTSPETVRLWKLYNDAAIAAIKMPGRRFKAGKCVFVRKNDTLAVKLPSGRLLLYANPKLRKDRRTGKISISYVGLYGGRESMYGGKLAENITQAVARDILAWAMLKVDKAGFPIVLHVHDEIVAEILRSSKLTLDRLSEIMCQKPVWAAGLPLAAEGYEAQRYRKN